MGLDITAYRQVKLMPDQHEGEEDYDPYGDGGFRVWSNHAEFIGRSEGVVENAYYTSTDELDFRAGSYGGYNAWREQLAEFAGYPVSPAEYHQGKLRHDQGAWDASGGPFWELIHFSDCEGTIGPVVSAKLAQDFADNQAKADTYAGPESDWFKSRYADWRKAFEMGADGGCVVFH